MNKLDDHIQQIAENVQQNSDTLNSFAVASVPFHIHNGSDSARVDFSDITNRLEFINVQLLGSQGQTANNWGIIFTTPFACNILGATEIHQTAESTSTTMTVQLEKLTGTQASGSGITLLLNPFDLKATANTLQTAILNTTSAKTNAQAFSLQIGDRLGLVLTRTGSAPATLIGVNIIIQISY